MAKAFVIAAGIIKVMGSQHLKYSQQLEDLVYASGYGVYTFIKGESERVPFFFLLLSNFVYISESFPVNCRAF